MKTKTVWIVGGVAGALIILYILFRGMQQSQTVNANVPATSTGSGSILDSLLGTGESTGIGGILSSAGGSVGSIFSGSDNFGDTGTDSNDPGLGGDDDDDDDDDFANSPGLMF